jgi:hypothetical protein
MFNQGAAAGAVGGLGKAMMKAGSDLRQAQGQVSPNNVGGGSPRKYRKILQASVDAHRQFSEIDTEHHGTRLNQQTEAALKLGEAGFHTIRQSTPFGTTEVQKDPGASPSSTDTAHNPSHLVHGHPGEGHTTVHGFTGDVVTLTPETNGQGPKKFKYVKELGPGASKLALPSKKATDVGSAAGSRPGTTRPSSPAFKASGSEVIKIGSFMDKPTKPQPAMPGAGGAIPMGSSATKGRMKGSQLKKDPASGKLTEAGWNEKLSSQESAYIASKQKKDNY